MQIERRIADQLCAGEKVIDLSMAALTKMGTFVGRHHGASQGRKLVHLADRKNAAEHVKTGALITLPRSGALQPFNDAHSRTCHRRNWKDKVVAARKESPGTETGANCDAGATWPKRYRANARAGRLLSAIVP